VLQHALLALSLEEHKSGSLPSRIYTCIVDMYLFITNTLYLNIVMYHTAPSSIASK